MLTGRERFQKNRLRKRLKGPAPAPWRILKNMRLDKFQAEPHMKELNVNTEMERMR
jgi:hypothetical protein